MHTLNEAFKLVITECNL